MFAEALETRQLLAANVMTDLPDYSPDMTAQISAWNDDLGGTNFAAGETVRFQVTRTDGVGDAPNGNLPWFVTDGVGDLRGITLTGITTGLWTTASFLTPMA